MFREDSQHAESVLCIQHNHWDQSPIEGFKDIIQWPGIFPSISHNLIRYRQVRLSLSSEKSWV